MLFSYFFKLKVHAIQKKLKVLLIIKYLTIPSCYSFGNVARVWVSNENNSHMHLNYSESQALLQKII